MNGLGSSATARLWRLAVFTAAGAFATTGRAEAFYYWHDDSDSYYSAPLTEPTFQRPKPRKRGPVSKKDAPQKEAGAKPQGPLVIAISLDRQRMTVYDSNGVFAQSPVSTGMKGHTTPMGVFSVIQKHKFHHSNIYSNAPMPYMQRITWSGVAIHAGVLPGYPASHGCIRMPMAFAVKMWNWTRMGARVVITPGMLSPSPFSHPLLASVRVPPQPAASLQQPATVSVSDTADKATIPAIQNASVEPVAELRSTVGHTVVTGTTTGNAAASVAASPKAESASTTDGDAPAATKPTPREAEPAKADTTGTTAPPLQPASLDAKDPTLAPDPAIKPEPKRTGPIAVFISRKDAKLYVRQNFAPLFEVPVTIAPSDRPLGTHVFTAEVDRTDSNALHWSVISLPAGVRYAERGDGERVTHRQHMAQIIPVAAKSTILPDSPAEALDRISVPADTMATINEMLTTGSSIIVSDQGINQGETGEGTDFIVRLR